MSVLVTDYLRFVFRSDPVRATELGIHDHDDELGALTPDAIDEDRASRRDYLRRFEAIDPEGLSPDERMDLQVALADIRTELRRHDDLRVWERAPYWYVERLGGAYTPLMTRDFAPLDDRGHRLLARLRATPSYLAGARTNLGDQSPPRYVEIGLTAVNGLTQFLSVAVERFADRLPATLQSDVKAAARAAGAAATEFADFLKDLHGRAQGSYACGPAHFDYLLEHFHLLDMDHEQLYEFGRAQVAADRTRLVEYAAQLDPSRSWPEQINAVKDDHPQPDEFVETYRREMMRSREHTEAMQLATLPEGEVCRMGWVPDYLRASLPIAVMNTTPPFESGLDSEWLITPSDPDAPEQRRKEQMRDNCYAFAQSIAGHEIYPGHHLQKVHHKLGTESSPMRRYFSSPLFVEGWGLYTEDLFEETGAIDKPAVMLFKLRNALWRSIRVVVDTGLHTRGMAFEEAVDTLRVEASLDTHMAEGEVRRYIMHDNPTYPSSYLVGKSKIHELRRSWAQRQGTAFSLQAFHDKLLGFGSVPVRLAAERMLAETPAPQVRP